ncbi:STY0301 family protein [Undibacterium sp. Ji83W]|uniref:STY0301 family protein n=1 Tax=Undibacterium sp. Ji83W TaxID=3413043 RepID=UPI003BF34840
MKILILLMTLFLGWSCAGMAQTCPPTIRGSITLKTITPGWKAKSAYQKLALERVSIIDGPMLRNPSEPDAELKPMEKDGNQYWAFGAPIGRREMWMRCEYAKTSVTLSKQIRSDTALCFQRSDLNPEKTIGNEVVAMCVDSSHKANETLQPYQAQSFLPNK